MVELSKERIDQILHEETVKTEELATILRSIYARYMNLYENYYADIDALNDEKIAELRDYHEETRSLIKYYYLDIPQDVCTGLKEVEKRYIANLLGPEWHQHLFRSYEEFKEKNKSTEKAEEDYKKEFKNEMLTAFYDSADYIFREGFGTGSQAVKNVMGRLKEFLGVKA